MKPDILNKVICFLKARMSAITQGPLSNAKLSQLVFNILSEAEGEQARQAFDGKNHLILPASYNSFHIVTFSQL